MILANMISAAILSSSVVERSAVNRLVASSNLAWGVYLLHTSVDLWRKRLKRPYINCQQDVTVFNPRSDLCDGMPIKGTLQVICNPI
jgi:hypothetical protein